ncbi:TIGR03758 family integrating conjugative element protein [Pseudomonas putida]|uniref:TIGR03758 family integrating conjugative element protein n=1 Tax=Pseudomonas putida TaxID=303 RepID=UPI0039E102CF
MSMTDAQLGAFSAVAGFTPQLSSLLWRSAVLVLALLWCAWVLWTGYRGWAAGNINFGSLGGSTLRLALALIVLMFFMLS